MINIKNISIESAKLLVNIELNNSTPLGEVSEAITEVLELIASNPEYAAISTEIDDLLQTISTGEEEDILEKVDSLTSVIDTLDDDKKQELYQEIEVLLQDKGYELEDIFDMFSDKI